MGSNAFGLSVDRLIELAARHAADLEAAEALALSAFVNDPSVDRKELIAFLQWRAIGSMKAACRNDSAVFQRALREAASLDRAGVI